MEYKAFSSALIVSVSFNIWNGVFLSYTYCFWTTIVSYCYKYTTDEMELKFLTKWLEPGGNPMPHTTLCISASYCDREFTTVLCNCHINNNKILPNIVHIQSLQERQVLCRVDIVMHCHQYVDFQPDSICQMLLDLSHKWKLRSNFILKIDDSHTYHPCAIRILRFCKQYPIENQSIEFHIMCKQ